MAEIALINSVTKVVENIVVTPDLVFNNQEELNEFKSTWGVSSPADYKGRPITAKNVAASPLALSAPPLPPYYMVPDGLIAVEDSGAVIGYVWDGTTFTAPEA